MDVAGGAAADRHVAGALGRAALQGRVRGGPTPPLPLLARTGETGRARLAEEGSAVFVSLKCYLRVARSVEFLKSFSS